MRYSPAFVCFALIFLSGCLFRGFTNEPELAAVPPTNPTGADALQDSVSRIVSAKKMPIAEFTHESAQELELSSLDGCIQRTAGADISTDVQTAAFAQDEVKPPADENAPPPPEKPETKPNAVASGLQLYEPNPNATPLSAVVNSVHLYYPLVEIAALEFDIATGKQTAAWGAFDTKLKAASENGPTGFYQTYRNGAGVVSPLYTGGEVFGGYRIGRGDFQPWYLERQTNDAGEFKAGLRLPWARNREIDMRRADLWRANYDRERVQPEIRAQLIAFVREASEAYWKWIALGKQYAVGEYALKLAVQRNAKLEQSKKRGLLDPPVLQDNLRAIAGRQAKLIERRRKLEQAAIKLSLYLRDADGNPVIPAPSKLGSFPKAIAITPEQLEQDIQSALRQRPEIAALDALYRRAGVDLQAADNEFLPTVDTQVTASQDVGEPTSSKRDKSEFELEAGLYFDLPLQRRKARGKQTAAFAKLQQIQTKRRFTEDKIAVDVRMAYAALNAAFQQIERTREARRLAEYMADVERTSMNAGLSDLLKVFLREQYAIEAADKEIEALLEYFTARAGYDAALARDRPTDDQQ